MTKYSHIFNIYHICKKFGVFSDSLFPLKNRRLKTTLLCLLFCQLEYMTPFSGVTQECFIYPELNSLQKNKTLVTVG